MSKNSAKLAVSLMVKAIALSVLVGLPIAFYLAPEATIITFICVVVCGMLTFCVWGFSAAVIVSAHQTIDAHYAEDPYARRGE